MAVNITYGSVLQLVETTNPVEWNTYFPEVFFAFFTLMSPEWFSGLEFIAAVYFPGKDGTWLEKQVLLAAGYVKDGKSKVAMW